MKKYILDSFRKKYGEKTFNDIKSSIENDLKNYKYTITVDNEYLLYIFEIAILENCDVENSKIAAVIRGMGNSYIPQINIDEQQKIHRNSINLIRKYFET